MSPAPIHRPAPVVEGVNFGDLGFYSAGGFNLPEGDYALFFDVRIHAYIKNDGSRGQENLGVMVTAYPLAGGEAQEAFLSLGGKAKLSFAPDAETGKKLLPIPGAPAGSLSGLTNFNIFLQSLYDCGMPEGTFTNDIGAIDGLWAHTQNIPEPEQRKGFGRSKTAEVDQQQDSGPKMTLVVTEIKEDGKPWENTGGMPEGAGAPAPTPPPAPRVVARPTVSAKPAVAAKAPVRAGAKAPPAPPAHTNGGSDDEALMQAALDATATVLGNNPNGLTRLLLRTQTFTQAKKVDDETAQAVIDTFFTDDASLNALISQHGYAVQGPKIVVAG